MLETGTFGEYDWVHTTLFGLHDLLQECSEVVAGKCVVITSFDSGPFEASTEELEKGWEQHGDLVVIPKVGSLAELPYDNYDEWHVFLTRTIPEVSEKFVNYMSFTLKPSQSLVDEAIGTLGNNADIVRAKEEAGQLAELQSLFLKDLNRNKPESFVADGAAFLFVTRNRALFERVCRAIPDE